MFSGWSFKRGQHARPAVEQVLEEDLMNVPGAELRLKELCRRLSEISDCELESFCEIPWGYATRAAGRQFIKWLKQAKGSANYILAHNLLQ